MVGVILTIAVACSIDLETQHSNGRFDCRPLLAAHFVVILVTNQIDWVEKYFGAWIQIDVGGIPSAFPSASEKKKHYLPLSSS